MNIKGRMLALGVDRLQQGHKLPAAMDMSKKNAHIQFNEALQGSYFWKGEIAKGLGQKETKGSRCISFSQEFFNSVVTSDDGQKICFALCTIPCHP